MALVLPVGFDGFAWEISEKFLHQFKKKGAARVFRQTHKLKSGFIVAYWHDEASLLPTHYLHRLRFVSPALIAISDFVKFGDEALLEDPYQYKTLAAMLQVVKVSRRKFNPRFGLVFWKHPEFSFVPDRYFKALIGSKQVSGSVTQ